MGYHYYLKNYKYIIALLDVDSATTETVSQRENNLAHKLTLPTEQHDKSS